MLNFDSRMSVGQSAHMVHFTSADYILPSESVTRTPSPDT